MKKFLYISFHFESCVVCTVHVLKNKQKHCITKILILIKQTNYMELIIKDKLSTYTVQLFQENIEN